MKPADPFRFSQATLEDTQEDELNAILGELSALQMSLDREISHQPGLLQVPGVENNKPSSAPQTQSDNGEYFVCLYYSDFYNSRSRSRFLVYILI